MSSKYDEELKKRLDFNNILKEHIKNDREKVKLLKEIKNKEITLRIKTLPKELQMYIYIYSIKYFYREYTLQEPKFTIYNEYIKHINEMKRKVIINNVHFLHLDCNTLPENKKYIMGCQCNYCIHYQCDLKEVIYRSVNGSLVRFIKRLGGQNINNFCNGVVSPSDLYDGYEYHTYLRGYNFKKENILENPLYLF